MNKIVKIETKASYESFELFKRTLLDITNKINNDFQKINDLTEFEKIIFKRYSNIISSYLKDKNLNVKEIELYLKTVRTFMTDNECVENQNINIIMFTCLSAYNKKMFMINDKYKTDLINSFFSSEIPYTRYKQYLDVLLDDTIVEKLKNCNSKISISNIIDTIIFDYDFNKLHDIVVTNIIEYLDNLFKEADNEDEGWFKETDYNFLDIHRIVLEQMNNMKELSPSSFNEKDFSTINLLKRFYNLSKKQQFECFECIRVIDETSKTLLKKVEMIILLINIYKELLSDKIISPDFNQKKRS